MRNIIKIKRVWALLLATAICLSSAQARQQQAPPTPPSAPIPSASGQDSSQGPVSPIAAPITTVTGGFAPSVGGAGSAQSQFSSGLYVSEQANSNVQGSSAISAWQPITDFGGHFSLQRMKANSTLVIRYSGGAQIDPLNSQFDNSFHQIEANQIIQFRRWTLSLDDLFGYSPESSFGFSGDGVAGSSLLGTTSIDPSVPPNQTILTPYGERINNTALAQIQVEISARTSLTFTGSDAILHYFETGYDDSNSYGFSAGYNYVLGPRDVFGVSYQLGINQFTPVGIVAAATSMDSDTLLLTYGHHIAGRYSFQAGIGPQILNYNVPGNPTSARSVSWSANGGFNYQHNQTSLGVSFSRGVTSGGGILAGAILNSVVFSASRPAGRLWSVNGSFGYSLNEAIAQAPGSTGIYNTLFGGVGMKRSLNRNTTLSADYSLQHQTVSSAVCATGAVCAGQYNRNVISITFGWDLHPIPINR